MSTDEQLAAGDKAVICGLRGRSDLNGCSVVLLNWLADGERWAVRCEDSSECVKVRAMNLTKEVKKPFDLDALMKTPVMQEQGEINRKAYSRSLEALLASDTTRSTDYHGGPDGNRLLHLSQAWDVDKELVDRAKQHYKELLVRERAHEEKQASQRLQASFAALTDPQRTRLREVQQQNIVLPPGCVLPSNSPNGEIQGGFARVRGLTGKSELNGTVGRLLSFSMEKKRFAFKPTSSSLSAHASHAGDCLFVRPQNLEAVDQFPEPLCANDSAQFCVALQASLDAANKSSGSPQRANPIVDLTPHVAGFVDMLTAFLFVIGNDSNDASGRFADALFYVQRTYETEPFFLFVREVTMSCNKNAAAPPFMIVRPRGGGLLVPPGGGDQLDLPYMLRFCLSTLAPSIPCPVCLEDISTSDDSPPNEISNFQINMFPCGHIACRRCSAKLFPMGEPGITCPTCKCKWENWSTRASRDGAIFCET